MFAARISRRAAAFVRNFTTKPEEIDQLVKVSKYFIWKPAIHDMQKTLRNIS